MTVILSNWYKRERGERQKCSNQILNVRSDNVEFIVNTSQEKQTVRPDLCLDLETSNLLSSQIRNVAEHIMSINKDCSIPRCSVHHYRIIVHARVIRAGHKNKRNEMIGQSFVISKYPSYL